MMVNSDFFVSLDDTLRHAMEVLERNSIQICFVLDDNKKLVGALTDGDIRRALLKCSDLDQLVKGVMNKNPKSISEGLSRNEIVAKMRQWRVRHLPVLNSAGCVVRIEGTDSILGLLRRENKVVLMAGGFGKRLSPLTDSVPKPLLRVGGRPILETILMRFCELGFYNFIFVVNYRAEMIKEYFQNGEKWGATIEYLHEEIPLGTCGGLSLLSEKPSSPIFVMNGDILTRANFAEMLDFHASSMATATMVVREHIIEIPYGVVKVNGDEIVSIEEKPKEKTFVNAGIYILSPEALEYIPRDQFYDMPSLFMSLKDKEKLIQSFKLKDYWVDIGRLEDFHKAQSDFEGYFGG
ncbi:nucleotidyltransferase family protein [Bdellovibrio bacteriovorus]|uniref:Mannose-1-phosphate guanyltransferase n=1 Tax=Bdellovibrio bacteriovorus (strain ATCC 15356 / DSM 50701 / NCIMB 9529 / HD100) TaxID=264462 RepID=Q6MME9_BDEBA|nr:nucleotidyltransferase family protein [Bdellovibrio bacteriovorus]CAE79555.1 Mannose-1-phosphate guanyltransferase [Bdellovibrio bacteriovorus HD100]